MSERKTQLSKEASEAKKALARIKYQTDKDSIIEYINKIHKKILRLENVARQQQREINRLREENDILMKQVWNAAKEDLRWDDKLGDEEMANSSEDDYPLKLTSVPY